MKKLPLSVATAAMAASVIVSMPAGAAETIDTRLAAADAYLSINLGPKLLNHSTVPHWIGETEKFWIDLRTAVGHEFLIVDAASGDRKPAFDHQAMAAALSAATGARLEAAQLPVWSLTFNADMTSVVVVANGQSYSCDLPVTACAVLPGAGSPDTPARAAPSPDGSAVAYLNGNDLWLKRAASGEDQRLTFNGIENFSYGDVDAYADFLKVLRRRHNLPQAFGNVAWSPDGRYLLALRQDLRTVTEKPLLTESLPPEGGYGIPYAARVGTAIEAMRPPSHLALIDTSDGRARPIAIDPQALNDYALFYFTGGLTWWPDSGREFYLISANRGGTLYHLTRVDIATGAVSDVITEKTRFGGRLNPYDYARPNVHVMASGKEAIWYSERDGWGHLYLYDLASGKAKRQITRGKWVVADLLRVDEAARTVYFTAVGRENGRNPYYRHLYRANIDTGRIELLTPEDADHDFKALYSAVTSLNAPPTSMFSPSGKYFVDSYSTVDKPPVMVVRDNAGRLIAKVMEADASALTEMGVNPPERVVVKAADGITDLYGVLYKPIDFDPSKTYPVVNVTYPGPQGRWAPLTYRETIFSPAMNSYALAKMGFVVVMVDGRGTTYRSRAFQEAFLGTDDPLGAADQVAAIKGLAGSRPYMDLDRVGVTGGSFGGYGTVRDMLLHPDVFKVGVAIAGPQDFRHLTQAVSAERYFGDPSVSAEARDYYRKSSNTALADRLAGKLLLAYGVIDENVPFRHGLEIFDALIRAGKSFDTLIVPDGAHSISSDPYVVRRMMAYFAEHLGGPLPRD